MKWDNIEALLQKYYDGETTVAEEKHLKDYFTQGQELPKHLQPHAAQFRHYAQQQEAQLDKFLADDWLFEKIEKETPKQGKQLFFPVQQAVSYWYVAASILLIAGAFWAGSRFMQPSSTAPQAPEIAALRQEIQEMKEVLAAGATADYSASDRIKVVSQEFEASPEDDEVISLLIRTMNSDPNVNVRLAASEALYQFKDNEQVRDAFIQSLPLQTDPLMQITLIDMLVKIKEKKAVEPLQKLAEQENLLPIVKHKAEEGIGILI
ncbi:HEAT repeat domain-containing protein [Pontibacter diazotrophicus]|uniref:HEAT repeat domain-containing protein n=1 Tax=Pontibacter diazotrophicus TaxID=1400979 RepID=A0A3D8L215_9BACT|nr:HEAT repeat domain-containing protein [Pontibacter diazotrophicus]RDV11042.1 HEAT repeat domain-containing protein [Pontibacter diazotrophicus]